MSQQTDLAAALRTPRLRGSNMGFDFSDLSETHQQFMYPTICDGYCQLSTVGCRLYLLCPRAPTHPTSEVARLDASAGEKADRLGRTGSVSADDDHRPFREFVDPVPELTDLNLHDRAGFDRTLLTLLVNPHIKHRR